MKCPKCGYIGFEDLERCRNCGYDFSLHTPAAESDLSIRTGADPEGAIDDLLLDDRVRTEPPPWAEPAPVAKAAPIPRTPPPAELPLFGRPVPGDVPAARVRPPTPRSPAPRPPLAVRRTVPEPARHIEQPRASMLDLMADPEREGPVPPERTESEPREPAGLTSRGIALGVDLALVAAIDALVVYLTLQICGLRPSEMALLPKGPLAAFFVVQNGGYFAAFTAGGQTIGKMLAGIRVVMADGSPLGFGTAVVRTVVWAVLAGPAGLGLLTAFFGADHRGLHDRCAGTIVVRETPV